MSEKTKQRKQYNFVVADLEMFLKGVVSPLILM